MEGVPYESNSVTPCITSVVIAAWNNALAPCAAACCKSSSKASSARFIAKDGEARLQMSERGPEIANYAPRAHEIPVRSKILTIDYTGISRPDVNIEKSDSWAFFLSFTGRSKPFVYFQLDREWVVDPTEPIPAFTMARSPNNRTIATDNPHA